MGILIEKPGLLTTIQDLGRNGYRGSGINPTGAMDRDAVRIINILLGNADDEAAIEMHFPAPKVVFETATVFAIGGADFGARIDDSRIENWSTCLANPGQTLEFSAKISGNRSYLAVKGGFDIEDWLGSRSTNLAAAVGGSHGRSLAEGDVIPTRIQIGQNDLSDTVRLSPHFEASFRSARHLRVLPGNEFENLTDEGRDAFLNREFGISTDSNRMGFRLKGDPITLEKQIEIASSAVEFGTIQLLPSGQMIILMADHQTTGGYPRIGHVISRDLPLLAQAGPNDLVSFSLVGIAQAESALLDLERDLSFLRVGCRLQAGSFSS